MKRYISAILIPCFLLQFFGCYSHRLMATEELKHYKGNNDILIKTNQAEIIISRKSNGGSSINWEANDSSVTIKKNEPIPVETYNEISGQDLKQLTNQETKIKYSDIESVEIDEINYLSTSLLVLSLVGLIIAIEEGVFMGKGFSGLEWKTKK